MCFLGMEMRFLEIPWIPTADVSMIVVDGRIPRQIEKNIRKMNIEILKMPFCSDVYDAIACHPDIFLHPIDSRNIVVAPNVYREFETKLKALGFHVIKGDTTLTKNYPHNIAYNIARLGNYAIHNFNYTDKQVRRLLEKKGTTFIHVKQGYAKCSVCIVNDHAMITSDKGIARAAEKHDIDVLSISAGHIDLPGLNEGLIGGASGLLGKNKLAFLGSLFHHPDYKRIMEFLRKHQVTPIFLAEQKIKDFGSILPILQLSA